MTDLDKQALVAPFQAQEIEEPLPEAPAKRKRQIRYDKGETYTIHTWLGLSETYATRPARHAGEDLALIDLINLLERAAREKLPARAEVRDEDHVMYVGRVVADENFAVEYGIPKR